MYVKKRNNVKNSGNLILSVVIILVAGFFASNLNGGIIGYPLLKIDKSEMDKFEITLHNPGNNYNVGPDAFDRVVTSLILKSNIELSEEDISSITVNIDGNIYSSYEKNFKVLNTYLGYMIVTPISPDFIPEGMHQLEFIVELNDGKTSSVTHNYFSDMTPPEVEVSSNGYSLRISDENGIKGVGTKHFGEGGFENVGGPQYVGKVNENGREYLDYKFENQNLNIYRIVYSVLDNHGNERVISSSGALGTVAVSSNLYKKGFIVNNDENDYQIDILENKENNQESSSTCVIPAVLIVPLYYKGSVSGDKKRVETLADDYLDELKGQFLDGMELLESGLNSQGYGGIVIDEPIMQKVLLDIEQNPTPVGISTHMQNGLLVGVGLHQQADGVSYLNTILEEIDMPSEEIFPVFGFYMLDYGSRCGISFVNHGLMLLELESVGSCQKPDYVAFHETGHILGLDHVKDENNLMYYMDMPNSRFTFQKNQAFAMKAHLCGTSDGEPISFLEQSGEFGVNINLGTGDMDKQYVCENGIVGENEWCEKGLSGPNLLGPEEICVKKEMNPPHWQTNYPYVCNSQCGCDPVSTTADSEDPFVPSDTVPPGGGTGAGELGPKTPGPSSGCKVEWTWKIFPEIFILYPIPHCMNNEGVEGGSCRSTGANPGHPGSCEVESNSCECVINP